MVEFGHRRTKDYESIWFRAGTKLELLRTIIRPYSRYLFLSTKVVANMAWFWKEMWVKGRGWNSRTCREIDSLTLIEHVYTGRTADALLALESGTDPNSENLEGKSVLCIAISLGNIAVVEKLLGCGADISTYYPDIRVPVTQESWLVEWSKQCLVEVLFRLPSVILRYMHGLSYPLLDPVERFFPFQQFTKLVLSREPVQIRQIIDTLLPPLELFSFLRLGSVYLRGSLQQICNESLQSWSIRSSFFQAILLIYVRKFHQYVENRFKPNRPHTPGNDALKELLAYTPDGNEMAMLLLQYGIGLGSPTQVGGQAHELLRWAVHRGYVDVVQHLFARGISATLGLPMTKDPNRQMNYQETYYFNREPILVRAAMNLHKDMVKLLLDHTKGDYRSDLLDAALVECVQAAPSTKSHASKRNGIVEMLLNCGANPNARLKDGKHLLSCVHGYDGEDVLTLLLSAGANPASIDSTGQTTLHHACFYTQKEDSTIIIRLLDAGAPIDIIDNEGHTALWKVASWGRPHTLIQLVKRGADVDLRGEGASTPLMEACVHNGLDMVQELLKWGADPNAFTRDDTPLLAAVRRKNPKYDANIVQVLLDAGAQPILPLDFPRQPLVESVHSMKGDWTVAILEAAKASDVQIPQSILDEALKEACISPREFSMRLRVKPRLSNYIPLKAVKALVNAGGDASSIVVDSYTVLHAICQSTDSSGDEEETLQAIVDRSVSLDIQEGGTGPTPLHIATHSSKIKTVRTLLRLGASVDIVDAESQTPLLLACRAKRREWTQDSPLGLGKAKLSTHSQYQGVRGEAALHFELISRSREVDLSMAEEDIVECLLDHGADPLAVDDAGLTPLHRACKAGNTITAGRILRGRDQLWELIGRPTRRHYTFFSVLSARDIHGQLPLHWAARSGNIEVVQLLLATDLNRSSSSTERDDWPLPMGREEEQVEMPQLLLKSSSDMINLTDNEGYTALHWAAREGHEDIVRVLLKESASIDTSILSISGHTALELAADSGHPKIVDLLETWKELRYIPAWTIMMDTVQDIIRD